MTDSDQNSSDTSQKIRNSDRRRRETETEYLVGTSERKANKNGIKQGTSQQASHKQHKQQINMMYWICRYGDGNSCVEQCK